MRYSIGLSLGVALSMAIATGAVSAEEKGYVQTRSLSMGLAAKLALEAAMDCTGKGYQVAVAVVDRTGNLLALVRNPLAGHHTIEVSQRKAYTAATYQTPTSALRESQHLRFTPNVILLGGGLPILVGGQFYGAVAVSGAPARKVAGDEDEACARTGIEKIRETLEFAD